MLCFQLIHSYPSSYIDKEFHKYFDQFHLYDSYSLILPMISNESQFITIHNQISPQPTIRQSQVAFEMSFSQIANENNEHMQNVIQVIPSAKRPQNKNTSKQRFFLHYTHEKRLKLLKNDIREAYHTTFQKTDLNKVKLLVGCRNHPKAKAEFIRRKRPHAKLRIHDFKPSKYPSSLYLYNKPSQKKYSLTRNQTTNIDHKLHLNVNSDICKQHTP